MSHRRLPAHLMIVLSFAASAARISPARAQDASFGCKVLLCAAATTPGWAAIPYCVPPMEQLFSQLAKGGSWPSCPEGGETSGLHYDPYKPCAPPQQNVAITLPTTTNLGGGEFSSTPGSITATPQGASCATPQALQILNDAMTAANNPANNNGNITLANGPFPSPYTLQTGTPLSIPGYSNAIPNPQAYYVDITLQGSATPTRFRFNLN